MTYRAAPLPADDVVAGNWYFGFECLACDQRFAVLEDTSAGSRSLRFTGEGYVQALCPHCAVDGLYSADRLQQFQAS